jgi:hypothetical protein
MFEQGLLIPVNQNLLTIFIAITTLAVLIQTGIVAGLLFATMKMSAQADRAVSEARKLFGPAQKAIDAIESASVEVSRFGATSQHTIREVEARWEDTLRRFNRKIA